jgi:hypothetical protein
MHERQRVHEKEIRAIPDFAWKAYPGSGLFSEDWTSLFSAMSDKGIQFSRVCGTSSEGHIFPTN